MEELNAPATKGDIQQLRSVMNHQYQDLAERIADTETKLLQAFYSFAESNLQRVAVVESSWSAIMARLAAIEARLLEAEKRLNIPPGA